MTDAADEEALKRHVYWDHVDRTVRSSVAEYAYHARGLVLSQFKGSDEERLHLERAIDGLEPAIETIIDHLTTLKIKRPVIYKSVFQNLLVLLSGYSTIGVNHAFTEVVERMALERVRVQRSDAGKTSAKRRTATMTEAWHAVFDPIVKRLRAEKPDFLKAELIREARKAYGTRGPVLPSDRQLSTHIDDLVAAGELQAGPQDGRGRRFKK